MDGWDWPVAVEGSWSPAQTRTVRNKLQLYFQSRRKSSGGDCRVELEEGAPRAAVVFRSEDVRDRVLAKENHEIIVDNQTIKLRLISAASSTISDDTADSSTDSKTPPSEDGPGGAGLGDSESAQSAAVTLENVADDVSRDLLLMLVENISGLDEDSFSLEIIWESNRAVVVFSKPEDAEKFVTASRSSRKMQKHGLTARPLEAATSLRVENLPSAAVKDILDLYFEKNWTEPDRVVMVPNEQAAIVTFSHSKVVEDICRKQDYMIGSSSVKVYPYHESLGTALYGRERPIWRMPESVSERVHHAVWKFLLMKKQLKAINEQMSSHFCSVDLESPEAKLCALPSLLRQKGLTADHLATWGGSAQQAFRRLLSQYSAFECPANAPAWKAAEKDVRSVVKEDAVLVLDASKGALTVAGRADDIKRVRAPVENLLLKAMSQIERQTYGISEVVTLSPAMFYILKQEGLQRAALDISPEVKLSYDNGTQTLNISGLPAEVYKTKAWILESNMHMKKKLLTVSAGILDFLKTVDPMDMSEDLFTSQGVSAIYHTDNKGVLLLASSDKILADAESRMKTVLSVITLDVEDREVVKLQNWMNLNQQLLDTYNSSKKKTVDIKIHPETADKITVAGFTNPVKEVSGSLREFITNYSQVKEAVRVQSCAVVQFIHEKKSHDWSGIAKANDVTVHFDPNRPRILISGVRLHVHKAKSSFQKLAAGLFADTVVVDKPGAKKYFQSHGNLLLLSVMSKYSCVVILRPENPEEEEDDEEEGVLCYCRVKTSSGVLLSVSQADICSLSVDAVVNAANEELKHIGGLALALLRAAGPQLQKISDEYVSKCGHLRPGDAIVTEAANLPCKYVVHAVGPRFSESDRKTAVWRLKLAVKESLKQAEKMNCSSIALPAISSGVFGFPVDLCASTIAQAVREYCDSQRGPGSLTEIHLVDNNRNTVGVLAKAVNQEFSDLRPTTMSPQRPAGASGGHQRGRGRGGRGRGRGAEFNSSNRERLNTGGQYRPGGHGGLEKMEQTTAEGLKIALHKGNIQDQRTDVIVNTIAENMNLSQGGVSSAILAVAGFRLQSAVHSEAGVPVLKQGDVIVTDGFNLKCQKVFHIVCPPWDTRGGQAEEVLMTIIRRCLEEAEKRKMTSLSFPAIGTGNLNFPRDVVSSVLLREIHSFSHSRSPRHLRQVSVVVHPGDQQAVDSFSREFKGQTGQGNVNHEASPVSRSSGQSQPASAFSQVSSPSLGVYRMDMGQLTLEVSSGDITKETSDVIVNSSNKDFSLKSGVSKAVLDAAGTFVEQECSKIVTAPGYQPSLMIITSAGRLPSRNIIHVVGQNEPAKIKEVVSSVLKVCEENGFQSVSFPALGTGQGRANPSEVADAMVKAVVEFVRKKQPKVVSSVKILIFQTSMMAEFHKSMKKRAGEEVEEKGLFNKIRDGVSSFLGLADEQPRAAQLVLERQEFEPTEFELCADDSQTLRLAKKDIELLIMAEQAQRTVTDPFISQLSQADMQQLKDLQRQLTVSIRLDDQLPSIHLEGLTRDVFAAESEVRKIIQTVERTENLKTKALMLRAMVQWQFQDPNGTMVDFDIDNNLKLEEALVKKDSVVIQIKGNKFKADVQRKRAFSVNGHQQLELIRKDLKDDAALPALWDDMKGDIVKLFPLTTGSKEYSDVEKEFRRTGLNSNIISIERVQNTTLWKSYQLLKTQLELKNKHTNNEKLLFHGTGSTSIDLINNKGFNRSYAGTHGAMYGNGSYFAVDPAYSKGYAQPDVNSHKRMYLARVLVGDYTVGRSGLIAPPAKPQGKAADLYDSVTDPAATMFVVFNDIQAYPEYLITFT
ncbi:protein mono-ADP-ribosyltransferase PARP14-like [Echeneis naucrates]|uniref:Poly [ADP-ribose] polymerase n=1 Tax=Echeneis naucrates TaxID=173247 RepID=A0A665VJ12_ECHNA|nr:protein mono-ADP-ribosyltransferase PARP14-like [Echeneis naucrates]